MKVTPLGISSGRPTLTRGLSSVAVQLDGPLVLLDCGEGTQWQLARASMRPTSKLEAVFITHLHGDHLTGLPGLLGTMTLEGRSAPLFIAGPLGLREYLEQMRKLALVRPHFELRIHEVEKPGLVYEGDGFRVLADELTHRVRTFGYRLEEHDRPGRFDAARADALGVKGPLRMKLIHGESVKTAEGREVTPAEVVGPARPGLKLAYCTDCVPCDGAVRLATGADLLVHEATYLVGHVDEAKERGHSTAAQAAEIAKRAGAKRLLLTHFSPRYETLEAHLEEARAVFTQSEVAVELQALELVPPG
ncbi:MAG: ribonuclease Z [Deltaproteobacteria bacterium]|nr:ribonuclease Z [Deltaproteobacteria bacterium]